jgi:hypothetical protein
VRSFDSSIEVKELSRFGLTHHLRISICYPLLGNDQKLRRVFERTGDRRCE